MRHYRRKRRWTTGLRIRDANRRGGVPNSTSVRRVALLNTGTPSGFLSTQGDANVSRSRRPSFSSQLAIALPGRINLSSSPSVPWQPCKSSRPDWASEQYSGLLDMTGDGRPDYIYYGDDAH